MPTTRKKRARAKRVAPLSTDRLLAFAALIVGLSFGFIAVIDIYPLAVNILVYLFCLTLLLFGGWKWEGTVSWRLWRKLLGCGLVTLVFCIIVSYPVSRQYERETSIKLSFKQSPLLTWWIRQRIIRDVAAFKQYLKALDIVVPEELPPVAVSELAGFEVYFSNDCCRLSASPYRGELSVKPTDIHNRMAATDSFVMYVVLLQFEPFLAKESSEAFSHDARAPVAYAAGEYYNSSFWDTVPTPDKGTWTTVLWEVRDTLGKAYTDRLVASALKVALDSGKSLAYEPNGDLWFASVLWTADHFVESDSRNWPGVAAVLARHGKPTHRLHNYFPDWSSSKAAN